MFGFPADDESERYRKAGITMRSMARKEVYSDEEDEYFDRTLVKEDRVFDKEERTKKLQKAAEQYSFSDLRMKLDDLVHLKSHMTRELLDLNMGKLRRKNQDDLDAVLEEANEDLVREKKVELINALKKNLVDIEE